MEKYYKPHIDEFYVGFEYERMNGDKWESETISVYDFYSEDMGYDNEFMEINKNIREVRVKYLDTNDIISLGFDLIGEGREMKIFRRVINEKHNPILVEIRLNYEGDFPIISIIEASDCIINSITCYNKSELRWILNRLRII